MLVWVGSDPLEEPQRNFGMTLRDPAGTSRRARRRRPSDEENRGASQGGRADERSGFSSHLDQNVESGAVAGATSTATRHRARLLQRSPRPSTYAPAANT